ncbi:MAG: hypothetical protein MUF36_03895 [Bacteroidales bacterium]|jgi:hypothetical protein|nr:hypothetical protein [Bacteroidales bacterium]
MNKIKMTAGLIWALCCLIVMIMLYFALGGLSEGFAKLPFMKLNPNTNGGELAQQVVMDNCTLMIRKPVFDGLLRERNKGFVQIEWKGDLPGKINDTIDYNMDSSPDFVIGIIVPENQVNLVALNPKVRDVGISTSTSYGWAARINIDK